MGWGREAEELQLNGYRDFAQNDGQDLERDRGDSYTTVPLSRMLENG